MGSKGRGAYVPGNDTGKICQVKSEVLNSSDIRYLGQMSGKNLRGLGPIRVTHGLGPNLTYPLSELTMVDCTRYPHLFFLLCVLDDAVGWELRLKGPSGVSLNP